MIARPARFTPMFCIACTLRRALPAGGRHRHRRSGRLQHEVDLRGGRVGRPNFDRFGQGDQRGVRVGVGADRDLNDARGRPRRRARGRQHDKLGQRRRGRRLRRGARSCWQADVEQQEGRGGQPAGYGAAAPTPQLERFGARRLFPHSLRKRAWKAGQFTRDSTLGNRVRNRPSSTSVDSFAAAAWSMRRADAGVQGVPVHGRRAGGALDQGRDTDVFVP